MDLLIPNAYAQGGPGGPGLIEAMLPFLVLFAVFWFLLIRPQQKKVKEHRKMVEALSKGDEVVTNGGLLGKVSKVGDAFVTIEIADGTEVRVQRMAVAALMPKGTMKSV
ncbi:MAG: preprotein translocase subunit YajC [Ectothiorhodospiraceae bacterium]|nr:preprotein translocase subunit YajC [Ectothiorhodospiraceae bacterium]